MNLQKPQNSGFARLWLKLRNQLCYALILGNALVLLVASWAPHGYMPRSEFLTGHVEHFIVYCLGGLACTILAWRHAAWQVAAVLMVYAGILELGQAFVPGRHAAFGDFMMSAAGAVTGVTAAAQLRQLLGRELSSFGAPHGGPHITGTRYQGAAQHAHDPQFLDGGTR
jgi:VanZ family protein